jgi:hypothetical protein
MKTERSKSKKLPAYYYELRDKLKIILQHGSPRVRREAREVLRFLFKMTNQQKKAGAKPLALSSKGNA